MTVVTLRPASTDLDTGWVPTGAASEHAAVSDDSDASYIVGDNGLQIRFGLTDISLPDGAIVQSAAVRLRSNLSVGSSAEILAFITAAGGVVSEQNVLVTWSAITTATWLTWAGSLTDAEIDAATLTLVGNSGAFRARVYEAYVDVTYVALPVVTVTAPSGTVSTTNLPLVEWAGTLDAAGGAQARYEAKIFTAAQYGAGDFTPGASSPFAESGVVESAEDSWQPSTILPDGTYRAYVRIAQSVNGSPHWSEWAYSEFTVSVALPGVPALTVTPQPADGRVRIDAEQAAGAATTDAFEIQRSLDAGATWTALRGPEGGGIFTGSGVYAYDFESPNGVTVQYRARALHHYGSVSAGSAWATASGAWTSASQWLKHPTRPAMNASVVVDAYAGQSRQSRQGVFQPLGRADPVVVSDKRGPATGTVTLRVDTLAEQDALDALLDTGSPLLLQAGADDERPDRWIVIGQHDRTALVDKSWIAASLDTLAWTEVAEPAGNVEGWPGALLPAPGLLPSASLTPA